MDGKRVLACLVLALTLVAHPALADEAEPSGNEAELPAAPEPLVIEGYVPAAPPAWYQTGTSLEVDLMLDVEATTMARGDRTAVAKLGSRWVLIDRRDGVVGFASVPDGTVWVGLDGQDTVYAATESGRLYQARNPDAALREDGFRNTMTIENAVAWDINATNIVAITDTQLAILDPSSLALLRGELPNAASDVFLRNDGVVVIQEMQTVEGADPTVGTWVSPDLGKSWSAVEEPALVALRRVGQRIEEKSAHSSNTVRSLASDGTTWLVTPVTTGVDWHQMARVTLDPRGVPSTPTFTLLEPAAHAPDAVFEPNVVSGMSSVLGNLMGTECRGAECLRSAALPQGLPGKALWTFFSDGVCSAQNETGACDPSSFTRLPRLARIDRDTGKSTFVSLPADCTPTRIADAGGLGILFCAGETQTAPQVYVRGLGEDDTWQAEGVVQGRPDLVEYMAASDGTIFGSDPACYMYGELCAFTVRSPADAGEGTWSEVNHQTALAIRSLGGGAALLASTGDDVDHVRISTLDPQAGAVDLGSFAIGVEAVHDMGVEDAGCVRLVYRAENGEMTSGLLRTDGGVIPVATCAEAIDAHALSLRQGLLSVQCGPVGAKVNVIGSNDVGIASLNCPVELPLEPGIYQINVVMEDHETFRDEIIIEPRQTVSREVDLHSVPLGTVAVTGGGHFSDEAEIGGMIRAAVGFTMFDGDYEVGGLFRVSIRENPGYLGALLAAYVIRLGDFDIRIGGGIGMGSLIGQADGDKLSASNSIIMRYLFTSGVSYRLAGPVYLRMHVDLMLPPFLADVTGGLAIAF